MRQNPARVFLGWLFGRGDGTSLFVTRVLIGTMALVKLLTLAPYLKQFFSNEGWLNKDTAIFFPGSREFFSILKWLPDPFVYLFFTVMVVACLLMMIGYQAKWANIALAICLVSFDHRNPYIFNGFDRLLRIIVVYLCFADNRLLQRKSVELWPQRLIQLQIALMYLSTVAFKIMKSEAWRNGYAVRLTLKLTQYHWVPVPEIIMNTPLPEILCYATLATEAALGTLVFFKKARNPVLLIGILFHLGLSAFVAIPFFSFTAIFCYAAFLEGQEWRRAEAWLRAQFRSRRNQAAAFCLLALIPLTGCNLKPDPARLSSELFTAARYGNTELVKKLLEQGAKPNWTDSAGNGIVAAAAAEKHWDVVNLLLKYGAPILSLDAHGNTLLHIAAYQGNTKEISNYISMGIPIDTRNRAKSTALHLAADSNQAEAAELLLKNGANINVQNDFLETPLHVAAWRGNKAVYDLLVKRGANPKLKTKTKDTVKDYLVKNHHQQLLVSGG